MSLSTRLSPATPEAPNAVHYGTLTMALTGIALWAAQTYAYPHVPGAVQAEIPIVVTAAMGYLVSLFVRRNVPGPAQPPTPEPRP